MKYGETGLDEKISTEQAGQKQECSRSGEVEVTQLHADELAEVKQQLSHYGNGSTWHYNSKRTKL